jgi:hypothetical protein
MLCPVARKKQLHRDWALLRDAAVAQGWRIRHIERGHNAMLLLPPDPTIGAVALPCTPGSRNRGLQNKTAELRRGGLKI